MLIMDTDVGGMPIAADVLLLPSFSCRTVVGCSGAGAGAGAGVWDAGV